MTTQRKSGFLPFGSSEAVTTATCRSASDLGGFSVTGTTPGGVVYDTSLGIQFNTLAGLEYTFASAVPSFHVTYWIDTDFLSDDNAPSGTHEVLINPITASFAASPLIRKTTGSGYIYYIHSGTDAFAALIKNVGNTQSRVDFSVDNYGIRMYVECIPVAFWPWKVSTTAALSFTSVRVPGYGTAGSPSPQTAYVRDIQVVEYPINLPVKADRNSICVIGDSFTRRGQYPSDYLAVVGNTTDHYSDSTSVADNAAQQAGMLPAIHGSLNARGIHPGNGRLKFYGRGGTDVYDTSSVPLSDCVLRLQGLDAAGQDTRGAHGWGEQRPDIVFIYVGVNDVIDITPPSATTFDTDYRANIDTLIALNANIKIICGTIIAPSNHASYTSSTYQTRLESFNAKITALPATYSQVSVVDLYTLFGSWNVDSADFISSDLHPSPQGHWKIGRYLADAV